MNKSYRYLGQIEEVNYGCSDLLSEMDLLLLWNRLKPSIVGFDDIPLICLIGRVDIEGNSVPYISSRQDLLSFAKNRIIELNSSLKQLKSFQSLVIGDFSEYFKQESARYKFLIESAEFLKSLALNDAPHVKLVRFLKLAGTFTYTKQSPKFISQHEAQKLIDKALCKVKYDFGDWKHIGTTVENGSLTATYESTRKIEWNYTNDRDLECYGYRHSKELTALVEGR